MQSKITLVTPPDIYENSCQGILFVDLNDNDQDTVSRWLAEKNYEVDLNFYVYSGEPDIKWLLWSCGVCEHKYIDLDNGNEVSTALHSYLLGKRNFFYKTENENLAAVYSYINTNRIKTITTFLERALGEQTRN